METSQKLKYSAAILGFVVVCCLMPALLMGYLGYQARLDWNNEAIHTSCNITGHAIDTRRCSYQCNCYQTCHPSTHGRSCSTHCSTCYYTCYDGLIWVRYRASGKPQNEEIEVESGNRDAGQVKILLVTNYPVGSSVGCFYNKLQPQQVKLKLENTDGWLAGTIIFASIGGLILLAWFIYLAIPFILIVWALVLHYLESMQVAIVEFFKNLSMAVRKLID